MNINRKIASFVSTYHSKVDIDYYAPNKENYISTNIGIITTIFDKKLTLRANIGMGDVVDINIDYDRITKIYLSNPKFKFIIEINPRNFIPLIEKGELIKEAKEKSTNG